MVVQMSSADNVGFGEGRGVAGKSPPWSSFLGKALREKSDFRVI